MAEEFSDLFARMQAEADQNAAGIRAFGGSIRVFYEGLTEAGFSESAALSLTENWLTTVVEMTLGQGSTE